MVSPAAFTVGGVPNPQDVSGELIEALGRVVLAARPKGALLVVQHESRVVVFVGGEPPEIPAVAAVRGERFVRRWLRAGGTGSAPCCSSGGPSCGRSAYR